MSRELPTRRELLREFRAILTAKNFPITSNTQAVMVLSAAPTKLKDQSYKEDSPENIARITFGVELARKVALERSQSDDLHGGPRIILNGETEQLPMMEHIALQQGVPVEMIDLVDCGKRGVGNTLTQFEAVAQDDRFRDTQDMVVVTTGYHAPRVERTAELHERDGVAVHVVSMPYNMYRFNIFTIRGEIRRILAYAAKGDIAPFVGRRRR